MPTTETKATGAQRGLGFVPSSEAAVCDVTDTEPLPLTIELEHLALHQARVGPTGFRPNWIVRATAVIRSEP